MVRLINISFENRLPVPHVIYVYKTVKKDCIKLVKKLRFVHIQMKEALALCDIVNHKTTAESLDRKT